jgi:hypothetical protein
MQKHCSEHGKALFHSKHEARIKLCGQLAKKSIRLYECDVHHGQFHMTKEWAHKRRVSSGELGHQSRRKLAHA